MSATSDDICPIIVTERLTLRGWRLADFDTFSAFAMDPERSRYRGGAKSDRDGAYELMAGQAGDWHLLGFGGLAITRTGDDDTAIGMTGLWQPPSQSEPELFWSLFAGAEGQGFATEAAGAMKDWAAEAIGITAPMSLIHPDNHASRQVAKRLGARMESETALNGEPRELWRHRAATSAVGTAGAAA
ncbi:MAG: GNAT family N-acetyltransferase [Pseudomonadota bacterium]